MCLRDERGGPPLKFKSRVPRTYAQYIPLFTYSHPRPLFFPSITYLAWQPATRCEDELPCGYVVVQFDEVMSNVVHLLYRCVYIWPGITDNCQLLSLEF